MRLADPVRVEEVCDAAEERAPFSLICGRLRLLYINQNSGEIFHQALLYALGSSSKVVVEDCFFRVIFETCVGLVQIFCDVRNEWNRGQM